MNDDVRVDVDDSLRFDDVWHAIRSGDSVMRAAAIERIMPQMMNAVQRRFGSSSKVDADDATQSALKSIERRNWNIAKKGQEPRNWGELAGLLVVYAYNKARTYLKRRSSDGPTLEHAGEPANADNDPEASLIRKEMVHQVRAALDELSGSLENIDRVILRGKYDGLTLRQITEELQAIGLYRTEDAVRMRWSRRIVKRLRELLKSAASDHTT